jgi:TRAP-type C4-dicarboxylate transport system permease small subunit
MTRTGPSQHGSGEGPVALPPAALTRLVAGLDLSGRIVCVVTLSILFVALLANVILRYFVGTGLHWAYDIHAILLPWMVAGGLILATVHNRNIAITILPESLGSAGRRALMLLVLALTLGISVLVVWSSFPIIKAAQFQKISSLGGISQLWGYASLIYGFGGVAILCLVEILAILIGRPLQRADVAGSLS